jgi:enoyl-CoA hydratase
MLPRSALEDRVRSIAVEIAANAPLTLRSVKAAIEEANKDESGRDMERLERLRMACIESRDFKEGREAFMEKRKPVFHGR